MHRKIYQKVRTKSLWFLSEGKSLVVSTVNTNQQQKDFSKDVQGLLTILHVNNAIANQHQKHLNMH